MTANEFRARADELNARLAALRQKHRDNPGGDQTPEWIAMNRDFEQLRIDSRHSWTVNERCTVRMSELGIVMVVRDDTRLGESSFTLSHYTSEELHAAAAAREMHEQWLEAGNIEPPDGYLQMVIEEHSEDD